MDFEFVLNLVVTLVFGCVSFVVFLVFVVGAILFLRKLQASGGLAAMSGGGASANYGSQAVGAAWTPLAERLGLQLQLIEKDPKAVQGGGIILKGEYQGVPVEIRSIHSTEIDYGSALTKNTMTIKRDSGIYVGATGRGGWTIAPKDPNIAGKPTGVAAFDAIHSYQGTSGALSADQLNALASYEWLNLAYREGQVFLDDDWGNWYCERNDPRSLLNKPHPIWKQTTAGKPIDVEHVASFIELMIQLGQTT